MAGGGHRGVERLVALDAPAPGVDVGGHAAQRVVDGGQVGARTAARGEWGELDLQRGAGLDDVGQPAGVSAERLDHLVVADQRDDHRAAAVAHVEHPEDL